MSDLNLGYTFTLIGSILAIYGFRSKTGCDELLYIAAVAIFGGIKLMCT
jgi:hypothetical protein